MRHFALVGKSLSHSFSQSFFCNYFKNNNIDADYRNIEIDNIEQITAVFEQKKYDGLNVTLPYKKSIISYLDGITSEAQSVGAVNCVTFEGGKTIGHNTDVFGFEKAISPYLCGQSALILGNGGASFAVAFVLKKLGIDFTTISRIESETTLSYKKLTPKLVESSHVIINATPLGMFPNENQYPDIPYQYIGKQHLLLDLIYNPALTNFLKKGKANGATVINGYKMLEYQAVRSYEIWNSGTNVDERAHMFD